MTRPRIGVLGFGEAGGEISRDLVAAGADVQGYDPRVAAPNGVRACADEAETARSADVVLSVNSAADATAALEAGLRGLAPTGLWADLNTSAAQLKRDLAERSADAGVLFADVALMSPVPGKGLRTPMLVSGTGADRFAEVMAPLGAPVTVVDGPAGLAATKKLLRSVFFKGLAAAVVEALTAARAAGHEDWLSDNIGAELAAATLTVERLVEGSRMHAVRRTSEMAAAADLLTELGVPPRIAEASRDWLRQLADEADRPPPPGS
jgi:3-hydroxyisobutyrate dehydrogenase-like beta-hydroxyacid dehydrogenase